MIGPARKDSTAPIIHTGASASAWTGPGNPSGWGRAVVSTLTSAGSESIVSRAVSVATVPGARTFTGTQVPAQSSVVADWRPERLRAVFEERYRELHSPRAMLRSAAAPAASSAAARHAGSHSVPPRVR